MFKSRHYHKHQLSYSPVLENIQFYIRVLQYDVIVLHNGLYLLFHNISTEIDEKWA